MTITIIGILFAYVMGSIPSGIWIGKLFYDIDVTEHGSGNSGTTNVFRVLGPKAGTIVFILDVLKGFLPTLLPGLLFNSPVHPILFGVFTIIGHALPIFNKFKGGKSVATSFGVALAIYPIYVLLMISFFFVVLFITSMVSLASVSALVLAFICSFFLKDILFSIIVGFVMLFIIYRHRSNISRILNGTESTVPFGLRSSKKKK